MTSPIITRLRSMRMIVASAALAVLLADFIVPGLSNLTAAMIGFGTAAATAGLKAAHIL